MKKNLFFVLVCFFLFVKSTTASHVFGAELTYHCLGNDQYEISYVFYRDCFGIDAPMTVTLTIDNDCGFPVQTTILSPTSSSPTLITNYCNGLVSTCNGGTEPGVQRWEYTGLVTLGAECSGWNFSCIQTARSAWLLPFQNPENYSLFVVASLDNTNNNCNSSPVFNNLPVIIACTNQPFCIDPGISESDGDSIVCSMIAPLTSPNTPLNYNPGYSINQPMNSNPPLTFNNANGEICFNAQQPLVTTIAILVSEYRGGKIIGQVERDVDLYLTNCTGFVPDLSGINNTPYYSTSTCADFQTCFYIKSFDNDIGDTTTISWDNSIPNALLITTGGQHDSAMFCWLPGLTDISTTPHCFNATVTDNHCPNPRQNTYQYCITVNDSDSNCLFLSSEKTLISSNSFKIFPQPATDHLSIDFGNDFNSNDNLQLRIENILGESIFESRINDQVISIDIQKWPSASIHFAFLTDKKGRIFKGEKFIILKNE
jgi:hypothetical protein